MINRLAALQTLGRGTEARQLIEALIKVSPGSDGAAWAKPLLAGLSAGAVGVR